MSKGGTKTTTNQTGNQSGNATSTVDPAIYQHAIDNLNQGDLVAGQWNPTPTSAPIGFTDNQLTGQSMASQAALGNPGGATTAAGADALSGAANYNPLNVAANGYTGQGYTGQGYTGSQIDPKTGQWSGAQAAPAVSFSSVAANSQGYDAAQAANAAGYQAQKGDAASFDRSQIQNVGQQNTASQLGSYLAQFQPQFKQSVIDPTLNVINQQRVQALQGADGQAAQAGAFGGDRQAIYDAQTNNVYANQAAQAASNLGLSGFQSALSSLQNDQGRNQAAQTSNQGADLAAAQSNSGYAQQTNLANLQAANAAAQYQADANNQFTLTNTAAQNQARAFGATAANTAAISNAQSATQANAANAAAQNQFSLANQTSANLGLSNSAANSVNVGLGNQSSTNNASSFTAGANNNANNFNANATNVANNFNANAANTASADNASNGIAANGQRISAGNGLTANGEQQRTDAIGNAAVMNAVGDAQQNQLQKGQDITDANNLAVNNAPLTRLGFQSGLLANTPGLGGNVSTNGVSSSSGTSNTTQTAGLGSILGGLAGLGLGIGGIAAGVGKPNVTSDERLKTNIKPMFGGSAMDRVNKLNGVSYDWKGSGAHDLGLVAQDVHKAIPGAVSVGAGGAKQYSMPAVLGLLTEGLKEVNRKVTRKGLLN